MEKKTNKAKLEIFKYLRKSAESQGWNCAFYGNSINIHLTRVFLQAEFIFAMKTVQNPTVFIKMQK